MKKVFALLLVVVITVFCVACSSKETPDKAGKEPTKTHDSVITKAIAELKDCWEDIYEESKVATDGHFEIKNTRIITLKSNDIELFDNVKYIIEFELYTDYFGSAPYYEDVGTYDTVVVYNSGKMDIKTNLIRAYRNTTYQTDYSDFIKSVDDYCEYYNCVEKLN